MTRYKFEVWARIEGECESDTPQDAYGEFLGNLTHTLNSQWSDHHLNNPPTPIRGYDTETKADVKLDYTWEYESIPVPKKFIENAVDIIEAGLRETSAYSQMEIEKILTNWCQEQKERGYK
jgi:hypothetical protein